MPNTPSNPIFRIAAMLVVGLLVLLSATLNFKYWAGQAPSPDLSYLMGGTSFLIDLIKPMTPFWLAYAIKSNKAVSVLASLLLLVTCICFSMTSAIGLSSIARFDGGTNRQAKADSYAALQQERKRIVSVIDGSITKRHPNEVKAIMLAILAEPIKRGRKSYGTIGERSKNCAKPDRRSRDGCARYTKLAAEKAAATARLVNTARLAAIDKELGKLRSNGLVAGADPQANVFAAMLGIQNVDTVRNALVILFAWSLEYAGLVVPFFLWLPEKQPSKDPSSDSATQEQSAPKSASISLLKPVPAKSSTIH